MLYKRQSFAGRTKGVYVTTVYIMVKCLYLVNIVAQFMLLNSFLGPRYLLWGARIFFDLLQGIEWEESGEFPRVTMCDFEVRALMGYIMFVILQ